MRSLLPPVVPSVKLPAELSNVRPGTVAELSSDGVSRVEPANVTLS